jgi:glutaredoxin-like protein NrdH
VPLATLYSKPSCVDCLATYRAFDKKGMKEGIDFRVIDLTQDEEALAFVVGLGYQQAPVVVTADDHWSGFRPDKILALAATLKAA